ncbi:hypothetical protein AP064_05530 [Candidatus Liberibacter solanacearum]|uniref:Uncharacterized protein n=1 Tax=Candidatus Liberibacter solanacearum TaxID=556287 RepID=A0A0F4VLJ6_9HYPH|nr:hypothetical protein [Candidatus Liberibacter solanacearum]KJZ81582.1 hypothetical protein DJ66_0304 [Candidatus Liberibacter solanacearum]KQC48680.1 hypothetical protein AP064_05530 [Candidatus Liberibacter solanacearum]
MFGITSNLEIEELLENLKKNPIAPPPPKTEPSWHAGVIVESGKGFSQGLVDIGSHLLPTEYTPDPLKKNTLALNPEETGWGGHITHSLGHGVSSFLTGGRLATLASTSLRLAPIALSAGPLSLTTFAVGGTISVALAYGRRVYEDQRDDGVDKDTATKVGMASGATGGLGSLFNPFGKSILGSVSSGAGINLAASFIDRGTTKQILKSRGYQHLSDNIEMLDATSIAADTIIGGFFGYTHFKHNGKNINIDPKPSEVDLAMGAKKDILAQHDLNSGVQMNNESFELYYRNFEQANESFLKGEDFTVNPQEAEQLTQGTLFHQSEPLLPAFEKKLETFDAKIKALEDFTVSDASNPLRKDAQLLKSKIYETALACFYEHGGK